MNSPCGTSSGRRSAQASQLLLAAHDGIARAQQFGLMILSTLDQAGGVQDMNQPTFRLHPLKGNRKGVWAVTVRANWR